MLMSSNQPCSPASYRLLYAVVGLNNGIISLASGELVDSLALSGSCVRLVI